MCPSAKCGCQLYANWYNWIVMHRFYRRFFCNNITILRKYKDTDLHSDDHSKGSHHHSKRFEHNPPTKTSCLVHPMPNLWNALALLWSIDILLLYRYRALQSTLEDTLFRNVLKCIRWCMFGFVMIQVSYMCYAIISYKLYTDLS